MAKAVLQHTPKYYRAVQWAYGEPSPLILTDGDKTFQVMSHTGVRQENPLGPLLFSVTMRSLPEHVPKHLKDSVVMAYLDDVFILLNTSRIYTAMNLIRQLMLQLQLQLEQRQVQDPLRYRCQRAWAGRPRYYYWAQSQARGASAVRDRRRSKADEEPGGVISPACASFAQLSLQQK